MKPKAGSTGRGLRGSGEAHRRGGTRPGRDSVPERRLRPLDEPHPLEVRADAGETPLAVRRGRRLVPVTAVRETWRIDDEWWRRPISRVYHALVLEGGAPVTVFLDLETGRWYIQG